MIKSNNTILYILLISLISMFTSLYFSEVENFTPCILCWYQRILMYPLVFISGVALIKKDYKVYMYIVPLSFMGFLLSFYQYAIQKLPYFSHTTPCKIGEDCSNYYINLFNFITIPFLSMISFFFIMLLSFHLRKTTQKNSK